MLLSLVTVLSAHAYAQGGPPMVTDDPGTPGDGHWEINIASMYNWSSDGGQLYLPYVDANYGWGDHLQLKAETGYTGVSQSDDHASGLDTLLVGVKYRFLDEEKAGVSVSTYPQYQFPMGASRDPNLTESGQQFFLPIELTKTFGDWQVNPEVGYLFSTSTYAAIDYGVVIACEKIKDWELLGEIHESTSVNGDGTQSLLNFGFRHPLVKVANLMGALGYTLTQTKDDEPEWLSYLGVQLLL